MFGENLKNIRISKNISQIELASAVFVTQSQVSKWEKGIIEPSLDKLIAVANHLCCTVDELLSRENYATGNIEIVGEMLNENEKRLLRLYRSLDEGDKREVIGFVQGLAF